MLTRLEKWEMTLKHLLVKEVQLNGAKIYAWAWKAGGRPWCVGSVKDSPAARELAARRGFEVLDDYSEEEMGRMAARALDEFEKS